MTAVALRQHKNPASSGAGFLWAVLLSAGAMLPSASAIAQVRETDDYLQRMDGDGDGRIALAEYQHWMGYAFERMDLDRNDVLDPTELPGGRGRPVTRADHRVSIAAMFGRQDRDDDGTLDATELAAPPQ